MQAGGVLVRTGPDGKKTEWDTQTCIHCGIPFRIPHKSEDRKGATFDFCRSCMGAVCPSCAGKPCLHIMKAIEQMEARYHARRSYGI